MWLDFLSIKYREMLHYDRYSGRGLPIATGVIEGAFRHLLKKTARTPPGHTGDCAVPEAVLKLRLFHSNGGTEVYWTFHKTEELKRNHLSRMKP